MKFSAAVLVLAFAACSNAVQFQDCGGFAGKLINLTVGGCDEKSAACSFKASQDINIAATFLTATASKTATVNTQIEVDGSMVPLGKGVLDGCKDGKLACPLRPHQVYTMNLSTKVDKANANTTLRVRLVDENNNAFFCRQFPASVSD